MKVALLGCNPTVHDSLDNCSFDATVVKTAAELYDGLSARRFDVVILDARAMNDRGLEVARHARALSPAGLMVVLDDVAAQDAPLLLSAGADIYMCHPLRPALLSANLLGLCRRVRGMAALPGWHTTASGWRLNSPANHSVELTPLERGLVAPLIAARGQVVSRQMLIQGMRDGNPASDLGDHRLEMVIYRLRRKVRVQTGLKLPLRSVRGQGYVLATDDVYSAADPPGPAQGN